MIMKDLGLGFEVVICESKKGVKAIRNSEEAVKRICGVSLGSTEGSCSETSIQPPNLNPNPKVLNPKPQSLSLKP